ncbi:MAG: preQ(1) synthase [Vampirovibrio sp.]|nr:preQ(1) synthase [Vampirovibrio sp.]
MTVATPEQQTFPPIEVWENKHSDRDYTITISVPEYTAVCPMTGLPDFGTIQIEYIPDKTCIELKAFKYYILAYRNCGIFYENAVNKILTDIVKACNPRYLNVTGNFTSRGGISTSVEVEHYQPQYQVG